MYRSAAVILLAALSALPLRAQVVTGTVRDGSGRPLPGANVVVDGTTLGAASDVDGNYRIDRIPEGDVVLTASAVGYRSERRGVRVGRGIVDGIDFVLEEIVLNTGEVIVTASRREQLAVDAPASVAVLNAGALARRGTQSLDDALRYVPGVHVQENQVNVRGSSGFAYNTGSRVLLLMDGMPLLTPDTDGMPFDALPIAQIERIEVLKGPGSALYGGGALGGVVNVITREAPDRPETRVIAFVGVHPPVRYAVWRSAWPDGDRYRAFQGVNVSHARALSPRVGGWLNVAARLDPGYLNYSRASFFQAFGKLDWRPSPATRGTVLVGALARSRDNFLFWNGARDALNPGSLAIGTPPAGGSPTGTNDVLSNQLSILPAFTHIVSPRLFFSVRGRLFGTFIRPIDDITGKVKSFRDGTVGLRYGGEVQAVAEPVPGRYWTFGASGDAMATRSTFFVTADGDSTGGQPESAFFAQWDESIGPLTLTAGARLDRYAIDTGTTLRRISPKAALSYRIGPASSLRVAYGHGFRVPSLAERFTDNRDFFPIVRNLALLPERSISWEIGARSMFGAAGGQVQLDGAVFRSDYYDLIEPRLVPAVRAFQFVNLTRARIRGAELSADYASDPLGLRVGYTLLDADDLTLGEPLASRSRHQLTTGADWKGPLGIELGADLRLMSAPERVETDFARFVPDADRLVAMRVVDLRAGWSRGGVRATIQVDNALDYYYLERPAYLAPPRRFQVRLDATF